MHKNKNENTIKTGGYWQKYWTVIQYKYKKTYSLGTRVDPKNAYTDKIDIIPTGQRILIGTQNNNGIGVGFISTISCCT